MASLKNLIMAVCNRLKVLQQNVLSWTELRKIELSNTYTRMDIDIILINSHGRKDNERVTLKGYNNYQRNPSSCGYKTLSKVTSHLSNSYYLN